MSHLRVIPGTGYAMLWIMGFRCEACTACEYFQSVTTDSERNQAFLEEKMREHSDGCVEHQAALARFKRGGA